MKMNVVLLKDGANTRMYNRRMDNFVRKINGPYAIWAMFAICNNQQCFLRYRSSIYLGEFSKIGVMHQPLMNTTSVLVGLERDHCIRHEARLMWHISISTPWRTGAETNISNNIPRPSNKSLHQKNNRFSGTQSISRAKMIKLTVFPPGVPDDIDLRIHPQPDTDRADGEADRLRDDAPASHRVPVVISEDLMPRRWWWKLIRNICDRSHDIKPCRQESNEAK